MKARLLTLLAVVLCCAACGAPSLRHKKDVNNLLSAGDFASAAQKLQDSKEQQYSRRDALLYYLDSAAVLHAADAPAQSDEYLALAQRRIDDLFTQSATALTGRYLINDLTLPYYPAPYENALTYYYRAMNFLDQNDIAGALVEANKAVFYLDGTAGGGSASGPFVQYFASLVFESAGKRDDARIARARAMQGYASLGQNEYVPASNPPAENMGEVVLIHENGVVPLKISQTFQVGWGDVLLWARTLQEGRDQAPALQNAVMSGLLGASVTLAYPVLKTQKYRIETSEAVTQSGKVYPTFLMNDVAAAAEDDLEKNRLSVLFRAALRAAAKRTAAVQARHATTDLSDSDTAGNLAEMLVNIFGALTEKADTRQWFTLPAQFRMARFNVPPGRQNIVLRFKDGFGNIVGEYVFENVAVYPGGRVYLHHRTAK